MYILNLVHLKKNLIWTDRKFRECCWDIHQTGSVGETILHLCLLNATAIHADLAKRLIQAYPKMINDIYLADEYFGKKLSQSSFTNKSMTYSAWICPDSYV